MTIDLLQLAKQVEETYYKDIELSFGMVRVYHIPGVLVWKYKPDRPAPVRPVVKMKIATGGTQNRPAKDGDPEFYEWAEVKEAYDEEHSEIQMAARLVLALRDVKYPDISQPPPLAARYANGQYPDNEILQKKVWLDYTILAKTSDQQLIWDAIRELNGLGNASAESVTAIKKNSASDSGDDGLDDNPV